LLAAGLSVRAIARAQGTELVVAATIRREGMRSDMPSFMFDSFFLDAVNGQINVGSDRFRYLLATSAYQPHKANKPSSTQRYSRGGR
jgi:hypothetical protein